LKYAENPGKLINNVSFNLPLYWKISNLKKVSQNRIYNINSSQIPVVFNKVACGCNAEQVLPEEEKKKKFFFSQEDFFPLENKRPTICFSTSEFF
jgi:cytochrome c oxidase assembly protein Cox11